MAGFLERYLAMTPDGRSRLVATLAQYDSPTLTTFAEHEASLAVRRGDLQPLQLALVALGIAIEIDDFREVLPGVAICRDAAERLGGTLYGLLQTVAPTLSQRAEHAFAEFAGRESAEADIAEMGYEATSAAEGFRYRLVDFDEASP